jgi:hypothetical protein
VNDRLEKMIEAARALAESQEQADPTAPIWDAIIGRLEALIPAALLERFVARLDEAKRTMARAWMDSLESGASRLPFEMTADQFAGLLTMLLDPPPEADDDTFHVCTACGLARPCRRLGTIADLKVDPAWNGQGNPIYSREPDLMPICPSCGQSAWMWSCRSGRERQPWHELPGAMPISE